MRTCSCIWLLNVTGIRWLFCFQEGIFPFSSCLDFSWILPFMSIECLTLLVFWKNALDLSDRYLWKSRLVAPELLSLILVLHGYSLWILQGFCDNLFSNLVLLCCLTNTIQWSYSELKLWPLNQGSSPPPTPESTSWSYLPHSTE